MTVGACRRACAIVVLVAGACGPAGLPAVTPAVTADPALYLAAFRTAIDSLEASRFVEARAALERAATADPTNDVVAYLAAVASLGANDREAAVRWLTRLDELASDLVPDRQLAGLAGDPRFDRAVWAARKRAAARSTGVAEAFRIDELGLLPEGIAFEPTSRSFLIGSIHGRKILRVRDGKVDDFVPTSRGLHAVLGIRVDPLRGIVWAATEADKDEDRYRTEDDGRSELIAFDAATGETRGAVRGARRQASVQRHRNRPRRDSVRHRQ